MPRPLVALWFALPLIFTLSCLAIARFEVHPYSRWASPAGQRLLGAPAAAAPATATTVRTSPPSRYAASARWANRNCARPSPTGEPRPERWTPTRHPARVLASSRLRTKHPFCRCRARTEGTADESRRRSTGPPGSLLLTALAAAPAGAPRPAVRPAEARGTAVAAARAAAEGIDFGTCAEEQELPRPVQCGTVSVPLDYARPDGKQIRLTVSRAGPPARTRATQARVPGRAPSSTTRAGPAPPACTSR